MGAPTPVVLFAAAAGVPLQEGTVCTMYAEGTLSRDEFAETITAACVFRKEKSKGGHKQSSAS